MTIRKTIEVITVLAARGVIKDYAITGAVAALAYIEPGLTDDLDVLISVADFEQRPSGLILLSPIEAALAAMGYTERSDVGLMVEGWPVQFIPVASALDEASLREATEHELEDDAPFKARILRPEYVVAKAISLGRMKDLARVEAFLDQQAVGLAALKAVLERFDLLENWQAYCLKSGRTDPLSLMSTP